MEKNKIINISIIAVIIFFIGNKTNELISEIIYWIDFTLQNENEYYIGFFLFISVLIGILVLVKIFNFVFKKDAFNKKTIFLLLLLYFVVHVLLIWFKYETAFVSMKGKRINMEHYVLSRSIEIMFPIFSLLYFNIKLVKKWY